MKSIIVRISGIEKSDRNKSDGILKSGKWVIIPQASRIFSLPSHWKVEIEIIRELDRVRIGKILRVIEELTQEEKEIMRIFKGEKLPLVFALFGLPDQVDSREDSSVSLSWDEIGERVIWDASELACGWEHVKCPNDPPIPMDVWSESTRSWNIKYVPGSVKLSGEEIASVFVTVKFQFVDYPHVKFKNSILEVEERYVHWGKLSGYLPKEVRKDIEFRISNFIPSAKELAEKIAKSRYANFLPYFKDLASLEEPNHCNLIKEFVSVPDPNYSADSGHSYYAWSEGGGSYKSSGPPTVYVKRAFFKWKFPGVGGLCRSLYPVDGDPEKVEDRGNYSNEKFLMVTGKQPIIEKGLKKTRLQIKKYLLEPSRKYLVELRDSPPEYGYITLLPHDRQKEWSSVYQQECKKLVDELLKEADKEFQKVVSLCRAWKHAEEAYDEAKVETEKMMSLWRSSGFFGAGEKPKNRALVTD